ncbi:acetylxylan esterase [Chitinophaga sp. MM2321]|uniref:alpha/beta hydrolase family protein n=1 Tax=Chitinophaga sp. MM2321 TaxID=3137178 RepID=UPI0032D5957A
MNILVPILMVLSSLFAVPQEPLPKVLPDDHTDAVALQLQQQAAQAFQSQVLPHTREAWEQQRSKLKASVMRETGTVVDHTLPLHYRETGHTQLKGYSVKNILFQTRPGVYATASLYVPDGKGPFPAVMNLHGHWPNARMADMVQPIAHSLALNGYVCLSIDAWGAGERTTISGEAEYHGSNLGASLMNVGNTLMGMQLTDNIRGVDLLCSLPQVDKNRIGATGASGGGNQTMWLAAMDERIRAAVPVVSVGTFEAYILNSNCVCELLPAGLTFTEEAGILAMVAPRALKICNGNKDANKSFFPSEMLRSYKNAAPVYEMLHASDKLAYELFDEPHGYWPEIRSAMVGWFDLQLKGTGTGASVKEPAFDLLSQDQLRTFPVNQRDTAVTTTVSWCTHTGSELRAHLFEEQTIHTRAKRDALRAVLRMGQPLQLKTIHPYGQAQGWDKIALETTDGEWLPLLHKAPAKKENGYVVLSNPGGKDSIPAELIRSILKEGKGIVLADLWGTGEQASPVATKTDGSLPPFHTLARSVLWLGGTIQGKWVNDLELITSWLRTSYSALRIDLDGSKETGLATLFTAALGNEVKKVTLHNSPVSYQFAGRDGIDHFNMSVHVPGIMNWGDVSLAAALAGTTVLFDTPVDMSGKMINGKSLQYYKQEFQLLKKRSRQKGHTDFITAAAGQVQ